jgi:hypothetical protein
MKPSTQVVLTLAALLIIAVPAGAQAPIPDPARHLAGQIAGRAGEITTLQAQMRKSGPNSLTKEQTPRSTVNLGVDFEPIYLSLIGGISKQAMRALEERRVDKQIGDASGSTAGSTSLVSKGGTPGVLAIAVENGALTQDISGTTVTFRGSPVSIVKAIQKTPYFEMLETDDPAVEILQKFSFSFSFDTSRGVADGAVPTFTATRQQFSAATLRYSAVDHKDPRAAANDARWNALSPATDVLNRAAAAAFESLQADPAIVAWVDATNEAISAASLDEIEDVVVARFQLLRAVEIVPRTRVAVNNAADQFTRMVSQRAGILREIAGGAQLVFDFAYQKPPSGPTSGNVKVVGSVGRSFLLTGNVGATFYIGDVSTSTDSLRDVQGSVQLDVPFGDPEGIGRYVFTLATKIQHMPDDLVAGEGTLFPGTKGTMALGQAKLTIPVGGSAARIPLSVTLANRTELIAEKKVFARAQIGFSYDLDAVLSRFKP